MDKPFGFPATFRAMAAECIAAADDMADAINEVLEKIQVHRCSWQRLQQLPSNHIAMGQS